MHGLRKLMLWALVGLLLALPLVVAAQTDTPTPAPTEEAEAGQTESGGAIEYGQTLEAELTEDEPALEYTFTGDEGDSVVISLISDDFDPYLALLDEDGDEIATDDDGAGNLDSRIGPFTLPADGAYTIVAQSYAFRNGSGSASGAFTLALDRFETDVIEYGETVDGSLTASQAQVFYSFHAAEGDSVLIRLSSDDFDSYLTLTDPDGYQLITNDDGGGNLNSLIGPYPLSVEGDYVITVSSLNGTSTGDYSLSLERAESQTIEFGDTVTAEFDDSNTISYFSFEGSYGDVIDIEVDGDVDTNLTLNDPFNTQIGFDEDGGRGDNPELTGILLNSAGTYTVLLQAPFGGEGSVELTLTRAEIPSLNDGPQTLTFSSSQTTRTLSYTGEADETVRISVSVAGTDVASPTIDISQNGASLSYINASSVQNLSAIFTIPEDGDLVLTISEYSYTNLSLEIEISSAE
jgi:hypothetical protein